jgi:hypothetical protein
MPQSCSICRHEKRVEIDEALVCSTPVRNIAARFKTSASSVHRHKLHLPGELAKAKRAGEVARADDLLDRVEHLIAKCEKIAVAASKQKKKNWAAALGAYREIRQCLELLGRLSGELQLGVAVKFESHDHPLQHLSEAELQLRALKIFRRLTDGFDPSRIAELRKMDEAAIALEQAGIEPTEIARRLLAPKTLAGAPN